MSVETPDYAAMLRRMIRAYGRRVGLESPEDLADMRSLADELERATAAAVAGQREAGFSWSDIARGLGVTRQTAWERYRDSGAILHTPAARDTASVVSHDDAC